MYDEGTTYTYSRCVEQCAAEFAIQQCDCIDAYMPGINDNFITTYDWSLVEAGCYLDIFKMMNVQCKIHEVVKNR